ncbi:MAG: hypothetical protein HUU17_10900 [Chthonomonadales bacterium]|nr:hypothetical protein [Chthonomonadales bacterium]
MLLTLLVGCLCGIPLHGVAQAPAQGAPQQPALQPGPKRPAPAGFEPYILPRKLFTPDDRWTYEGSDTSSKMRARFGGAIAYQNGGVSYGDNRWQSSGAYIRYQVWKYDRVEDAKRAFAENRPPLKGTQWAQRRTIPIKVGDEAIDATEIRSNRDEAVSYARTTLIRYGNHVVQIAAYSDLKAFGPRPKTGSRPWLCEAPYKSVRQAALDHWSRRKPSGGRTSAK